jgi:threonine/homoserine/homoserine lactone efflux protein
MPDIIPNSLFLRGLIVGVVLAAPIGAVGMMCITRSLTHGWHRAMAAGLGSAVVDALFGALAGLGLSAITMVVVDNQTIIGMGGGLIVVGVGVATYLAPIRTDVASMAVGSSIRDFTAAFMLSITNPATLLGAVGLFAAFGHTDPTSDLRGAVVLIAGVFCGSMAWWMALAGAARMFRRMFMPTALPRLNKIEGIVIAAVGLLAIIAAAVSLRSR